ncbi:hypothetical protein VUJ46_19060 [Chryseobacterium sp. MYb264]|uniref:hypothetical protein n=1 Tax=Chryseobacterium sp. MYb264 TaxID=2745153 RepID=UPI002E0E67C3|nr:hypothetical protein VUJ46_19060 [Chryseobacterium sp. MYb264]
MATYLSREEIASLYIEDNFSFKVCHFPEYWEDIDRGIFAKLPAPTMLNFNQNIRRNMEGAGIKNSAGIYMFFLEPAFNFMPEVRHLLYVGRVITGDSDHSFFKRFYSYVKAIGDDTRKKNLVKLTNLWPTYTKVYFYPLTIPDTEIMEIEDIIISKVIPPLNNQFKGRSRNSRQLY